MQVSDRGVAFVAAHEGFVPRAYLDPVGVLTIGYGFTMRSRVFAAYWRKKNGRSLKMGDRIGKDEALFVLRKLLDAEYGEAVVRILPKLRQHEFDAAASVVFNLGPRALGWRWARALKAGNVARAASILRNNYNTAAGRRLPGLVRRRKEEAYLLETGRYPSTRSQDGSFQQSPDDRRLLADLGYSGGDFRKLVKRFQRDHPPLKIDGLFGPASRAAALAAHRHRSLRREAGGAGVLTLISITGWFVELPTWLWVLPIVLLSAFGVLSIAKFLIQRA